MFPKIETLPALYPRVYAKNWVTPPYPINSGRFVLSHISVYQHSFNTFRPSRYKAQKDAVPDFKELSVLVWGKLTINSSVINALNEYTFLIWGQRQLLLQFVAPK